jgi:hypothetical protein
MKKQKAEEEKIQDREVSMAEIKEKMIANALPINLSGANQSEDNLITYKEFISSLKSAKKGLYYKILPRTLSFLKVLESQPTETNFEVSDLWMDDFLFFRYELQTINKKHLFMESDINKTDPQTQMFGKHPLSNYEGVSPVKDILREVRKGEAYRNRKDECAEIEKKCQEIYMPPGIVTSRVSMWDKPSLIQQDIRLGEPSDKIFKRAKAEQRIYGGMKNFKTVLQQSG